MKFKKGDKVTYVTNCKLEKGIIKSIQSEEYAFVVYNCNSEWEKYKNYTGSKTLISDLIRGWHEH